MHAGLLVLLLALSPLAGPPCFTFNPLGEPMPGVVGRWNMLAKKGRCWCDYSPSGRRLWIRYEFGGVRVWDTATGRLLATLEASADRLPVFFLPDENHLVIVNNRGTVIYDVRDQREIASLDAIQTTGCSDDGKQLLEQRGPECLHWNIATKKVVRHEKGPKDATRLHTGKKIVVFRISPTHLHFADRATGEKRLDRVGPQRQVKALFTPPAHGPAHEVTVSPDENWAWIDEGEPGICHLYSLRSMRPVHRLDLVNALPGPFAPDGRTFLVSRTVQSGLLYNISAVEVWETASGQRRATLRLPGFLAPPLSWSPNGRQVAALPWSRELLILDFTPRVEPATHETLRTHWNDLASPDAARAFRALHALALSPTLAGPYVERHLAVTPVPPNLAACIERLGADSFAVRQEATRCLERADEAARTALEKAATHSDLEIRRRATKLLLRLDRPSARTLQTLRPIELLEMLRRPAALRRLAEGPDASYVTRDARAALDRLSREVHS